MNIKSNNEDTKIRGAGVMQKSQSIKKKSMQANLLIKNTYNRNVEYNLNSLAFSYLV